MEYIVLGKDGKEYGPVDQETLKVWVEHGRVFRDTQIRNALMKKWNEAGTMDFLEEHFDVQETTQEEEAGVTGKLAGVLGLSKKQENKEAKPVSTAFKQKYIPYPASVKQRIGSFAFDMAIFVLLAGLFFIFMNIQAGTTALGEWGLPKNKEFEETQPVDEDTPQEDAETADADSSVEKKVSDDTDDYAEANAADEEAAETAEAAEPFKPSEAQIYALNNLFYKYFFLWMVILLLYYGIGLGIFAQTLGMWYWGLIIVKGYNDECFSARAFAYVLAMLAVGITTPLVVLVNPQHRSLQGYISGARIIRVAAKPKA